MGPVSYDRRLNFDTTLVGLSALIFVCLVPTSRDLRLSSYLLDLTAAQALIVGWAPLVSACFLFSFLALCASHGYTFAGFDERCRPTERMIAAVQMALVSHVNGR